MSPDRRDRRSPEARYVQCHDAAVHRRFVSLAEDAYARLARANVWSTEETIELPSQETVVERRGLFRRSREVALAPRSAMVTLVLAEAQRVAVAAPTSVHAIDGCRAGRELASLMSEVLRALVHEVAAMPPREQKTHPDYVQIMRLTAETTALAQLSEERGCGDLRGCVQQRKPEAGGRRDEDVEVTKIRAMLLQRAKTGVRS